MVRKIFIVSDGSGQTAEQALTAAMTQYEGVEVKFERRPLVKSKKEITEIVEEAHREGSFVVHTMVSDLMRQYMLEQGRINNVETIDLMGPLLFRLSNQFSISPIQKPGLFHQLDDLYFRRIETMDFAFKHDDGLRTHELEKAEIILVGVSRTFKTPLSIYMAFKGWLVANVPLILGLQPPAELFDVDPARVFALNTIASRLSELRRVRHERFQESTGEYSNYEYVRSELKYGQKIFHQHQNWSIVNVTNKPIEEIASEIIALMKLSFPNEQFYNTGIHKRKMDPKG